VLLPMFLQGLMGYTAFLAGLVLGPGGGVALIAMPVVGKLTERVDSRLLLGVGLLVNAAALWIMSGFNLDIDFSTAVSARLLQGLGMPLFFVSLTYLTYATVPREQMNNAAAIFNLLRNLGGSFGVAFVTTLLARRSQHHQSHLIQHLNDLSPNYTQHVNTLTQALNLKLGSLADNTLLAKGLIYQQMQAEATALAFNDTFYIQSLLFLALLLSLLLLRQPKHGAKHEPPPGH
jgi:DHA2 family multidrug resistance protein